jgi:uncharacterized repeat protein (TIGR03806 family)
MHRPGAVFALLAACCLRAAPAAAQSLADLAAPRAVGAFDLPDGFAQQLVADGLTGATGLAAAPDGRLFVCEQTGALRVVKDDKLLDEPFVALDVDGSWERGLIGVALDPAFPKQPYVYLCYIAAKPYPHHVVSRFTADGDRAVAGSEKVLLEGDDQRKLGGSVPAGHQGGGLRFGKDGKLYLGVGEQTNDPAAQRLDTFQGKLLRINADGSIPADNPLVDKTKDKYRAIYAYGLRNPFALAVQPGTGRLFINDVGSSRWEEINEAAAGANYGWPLSEGPTADRRFRGPLFAYAERAAQSITGGAFYDPPRKQFPERYQGKYFFADYILNWVRVLDPDKPGRAEPFAAGLAGPVALEVGPDGSLYVLNRNAWVKDDKFRPKTGSLWRIVHVAGSGRPAPVLTGHPADAVTVPGGKATFRVEARGEGLRYRWFRDGRAVDGADGPALTVDAATSDDGAHWHCVVSNAHGLVKAHTARLWVTPLRAAGKPPALKHGLDVLRYDARGPGLAALADGKKASAGAAEAVGAPGASEEAPFGLRFLGWLDVPRDGAYAFRVAGSGEGRLWVGGAEAASGAVGLKAGKHPLRLDFAHGGGKPRLELRWAGPGVDEQPVPADRLFRADPDAALAPMIAPAGGRFTGPVLVRIEPPRDGQAIRYTLDGTTPGADAPLYRGPLRLDRSATLKARLADERGEPAVAAFVIDGDKPYGLPPRELAATPAAPVRPEDLPGRLSQTGLFRSLKDLTPRPGVVPYGVLAPLWSDGALKRRWVVLPGDGRVGFAADGAWKFPAGTVFVKHFELGDEKAPPEKRRKVETRLLVVDRSGVGWGVTYRWRDDQSDAELLADGLSEDVPCGDGDRKQRWTYPSRQDCLVCHTTQAGFVLGVNTRQLNGPFSYPETGVRDNQLRAWTGAGLFAEPPEEAGLEKLPRLAALSDDAAPLEVRVRSYLDANCAQCHRPGGARSEFDARFATPLAKQKLLDGPLAAGDLGVAGARVVAPGDRSRSMLYLRMQRRRDVFNMPPLASHAADRDALDAVGRWIDGLAKKEDKPASKPPPARAASPTRRPPRRNSLGPCPRTSSPPGRGPGPRSAGCWSMSLA